MYIYEQSTIGWFAWIYLDLYNERKLLSFVRSKLPGEKKENNRPWIRNKKFIWLVQLFTSLSQYTLGHWEYINNEHWVVIRNIMIILDNNNNKKKKKKKKKFDHSLWFDIFLLSERWPQSYSNELNNSLSFSFLLLLLSFTYANREGKKIDRIHYRCTKEKRHGLILFAFSKDDNEEKKKVSCKQQKKKKNEMCKERVEVNGSDFKYPHMIDKIKVVNIWTMKVKMKCFQEKKVKSNYLLKKREYWLKWRRRRKKKMIVLVSWEISFSCLFCFSRLLDLSTRT
jgi:hypothetical protein